MKTDKNYPIGVVVARFQVAQLHETHVRLIQHVYEQHDKVLILLGLSPAKGTINNPLDFQSRKQMLLENFPTGEYPNLYIGYIKDQADDKKWSEDLDDLIQKTIKNIGRKILIWGAEEAVLTKYTGENDTKVLEPYGYISQASLRKEITEKPRSSEDFRAGVIWAAHQRYPTTFPTVDVIVYDNKLKRVLLARKPNETSYRLVGGFADPLDTSFEVSALRELGEETGLSVGMTGLHYIGSTIIDDWRYRDEVDKIKTLLYMGVYSSGAPTARDDIEEVRWIELNDLNKTPIVAEHIVLRDMFMEFLPTFIKNMDDGAALRTAVVKTPQG